MNAPMIRRLILKDWYLSRVPLALLAVAGTAAIALLFLRREATGYIALTSSFISLILLGNILPTTTIVNERKHRNLAFVMSLPISTADYTAAKMIGNVTAFAAVWTAIAGTIIGIFARSTEFGGMTPVIVVAALAPFVAFCLIVAVAMITESEIGSIVTMAATNIAYSFAGFFLARLPGIRATLKSPVPVWTDTVLAIISVEVGVIVLAIVATFYFQSRKTDFL
jgi:hypothetical protein